MGQRHETRTGVGIGLTAICFGVSLQAPANAQQGQGGLSAQLTYSEQFVVEDDGDNLRSDLGFVLGSATRSRRFEFDISAGLEKRFPGGDFEGEIVDPRLKFSYGLENRNTALTFDADYREAKISNLVLEESAVDESILVLDEGTRATTSVALGMEFGLAAPFGGTVSLRHVQTEFSDTQATGLIDSDKDSADLSLRFEINPLLTARSRLSMSEVDRDGGIDTRTEQAGVGATMILNKTLTGEVDVGITRVEQSGSVSHSLEEGIYYSLGLVQERPNGTLSGSLDSDIDQNGRRTSLRFDRVLNLPEAKLGFGLGISMDSDTDSTDPLYALSYSQNLPRGSFSANLEQSFGTDTLGAETLDTQLQLALNRELTSVSSLSSSFTIRDISSGSTTTDNTRQIDVGIDYNHALSRDWMLIAGYSHIRQDSDSSSLDTDDSLYLGVRLTREWRP